MKARMKKNMNFFNKYVDRITKASYDGACALKDVENDAYIDFMHDNITYQQLIEIRKSIANELL